jgi:8-amino-7-oxononanoate synthase
MDRLAEDLLRLQSEARLRSLKSASGIDFTSNDYLGFRNHPVLRAAAVEALENGLDIGAGGSRLLRGNHPAHESLEATAVKFFGSEAALFFASGYQANLAIMAALPARQDVILFDALIHASLRDGIQSNPAKHMRMPHNDVNALEDMLRKFSSTNHICWVVVESVYSMDGDIAPLPELAKLCAQYNAYLVVDEAHGTGVFGLRGAGLTENISYERLITLHTCGKALGCAGGLVTASKIIIDTLINRARPFIYSTAPMPLQAVLAEKALELCAAEQATRDKLQNLCAFARKTLALHSPSPIMPVIMGADQAALDAAAALQAEGFDVRAIRPPTVPENTARLRITINATHSENDITRLAAALQRAALKKAA